MATPIYDDKGQYTEVRDDDGNQFAPKVENRHYRRFLALLDTQGKTEAEWLAENPYVPAVKSADELAREAEADQIKALDGQDIKQLDQASKDGLLETLWKLERRRV